MTDEQFVPITWELKEYPIDQLVDYFKNPRNTNATQFLQLKKSVDKYGLIDKPVINLDMTVIGGHQRLHVLRAEGAKTVACWTPSRLLSPREVEELNIRLNANQGRWDFDILANQWDVPDLLEWGLTEFQLGLDVRDDPGEAWKGMPEFDREPIGYRSLYVHFKCQEDVDAFAALLQQKITEQTRSLWYPAVERRDLKSVGYVTDEP